MKKTMPVLLLVAALGVAFSFGGSRGERNEGRQGPRASLGLGQSIAGAWISVGDFGNGPFESVILLSSGGGVTVNNTLIIDQDDTTSHLTTAVGAWKRLGRDSMGMTFLIRIDDDEGALKFYEKVVAEGVVDGDNMSGDAQGLVYLPTQDPLDPDETPVQVLSGPFSARRFHVEPLNP